MDSGPPQLLGRHALHGHREFVHTLSVGSSSAAGRLEVDVRPGHGTSARRSLCHARSRHRCARQLLSVALAGPSHRLPLRQLSPRTPVPHRRSRRPESRNLLPPPRKHRHPRRTLCARRQTTDQHPGRTVGHAHRPLPALHNYRRGGMEHGAGGHRMGHLSVYARQDGRQRSRTGHEIQSRNRLCHSGRRDSGWHRPLS